MADKTDRALSDFVGMKMREYFAAHPSVTKQQFEKDHRMSPGQATTIPAGQVGVGKVTVDRVYRVLGFDSPVALMQAAYSWWETHGKALRERHEAPEKHMDPERARAVKGAVAMGVTTETIDAVLKRFEHIESEDWGWWLMQISNEAKKVEHTAIAQARIAKKEHAAAVAKRRETRKLGDAIRAQKATQTGAKTDEAPASVAPKKRRAIG